MGSCLNKNYILKLAPAELIFVHVHEHRQGNNTNTTRKLIDSDNI